MSCEPFETDLSAFLDGDLAEDRAWVVEQHLTGCASCQAERDALAEVIAQVGGLERISVPAEFTASLMARLDAPAPRLAKGVTPSAGADPAVLPDLAAAPMEHPCAAFLQDLSALIDRALPQTRRGELEEHLADCGPCAKERGLLQRVRDQVGSLPREPVGPDFIQGVMEKVEGLERQAADRARAAFERRAHWFTQLGKLAQAAGFLIVIGGGLFMAAPEDAARTSLPGFRNPTSSELAAKRQSSGQRSEEKVVAEAPPLPPSENQWELAVTNLDEARTTTQQLLGRYARGTQLRDGERSVGFFAQVPRNLVDDLHRDLDAARSVQTTPLTQGDMKSLHAEQDQVVLKSGFVLVGQVVDQGRTVSVRSANTVHTVARKDVERVETAAETRKLRILLHERD